MVNEQLIRIRVTLKGRPVGAYALSKEIITIGRNPESDICLENPGISRDHLRIMISRNGKYVVEDLGSANGTMVNDAPVKRHELRENDVIQVGKFSLWVTFEVDRRSELESRRPSALANEGTTVLSATELEAMIESARAAEIKQRKVGLVAGLKLGVQALTGTARTLAIMLALVAFIAGLAAGASAALLYLAR
jgi:pSer/pThr/pTyr-binding forkhead associated (FHA) protein